MAEIAESSRPVYSRSNPSPRYRALLAQYQQMHVEGEPRLGIPAPKTSPGGRCCLMHLRSAGWFANTAPDRFWTTAPAKAGNIGCATSSCQRTNGLPVWPLTGVSRSRVTTRASRNSASPRSSDSTPRSARTSSSTVPKRICRGSSTSSLGIAACSSTRASLAIRHGSGSPTARTRIAPFGHRRGGEVTISRIAARHPQIRYHIVLERRGPTWLGRRRRAALIVQG